MLRRLVMIKVAICIKELPVPTAEILEAFPNFPTISEVPFKPSRVILQDFTGVPVVVDLASMRDAIVANGGKAEFY